MEINWENIDTVLLDMDGTILDRHFDDHFWLDHVPATYSRINNIPLEKSKELLYEMFRSQEQTLNWTDLDYWSDRLGIDIPLLKHEVDHLIAVHPFVTEFLLYLNQHKKRLFLVTNAHSKTLDLKLKKTRIGDYFNRIISAHDIGLPKENPLFWKKLDNEIGFNPATTMLGEDSEKNLETASSYKIRYLIYVSRHNSRLSPKPSATYKSINYFSELIPRDGSLTVSL